MWVTDEGVVHIWTYRNGCGLSGRVEGLLGYEDAVCFDDSLDRIEGGEGRCAVIEYESWGRGVLGVWKSQAYPSLLTSVSRRNVSALPFHTSHSGSSLSRPQEMSRRMLTPQCVMAWRYLTTDWLVSVGRGSLALGDPGVR